MFVYDAIPTQEEINPETGYLKILDDAELVRRSRSGATMNLRLPDGRLVEYYECKSGRVVIQEISQEDQSLSIRY